MLTLYTLATFVLTFGLTFRGVCKYFGYKLTMFGPKTRTDASGQKRKVYRRKTDVESVVLAMSAAIAVCVLMFAMIRLHV